MWGLGGGFWWRFEDGLVAFREGFDGVSRRFDGVLESALLTIA